MCKRRGMSDGMSRPVKHGLMIILLGSSMAACSAMPLFEQGPLELPCGVTDEGTGTIRLCPESLPWCSCATLQCAGEVGLDVCATGFADGNGTCLEAEETFGLRPSVPDNHPACLTVCGADSDCDDGAACNGPELCVSGLCEAGPDLEDGASCGPAGDASRVCRGGLCVARDCGNNVVDPAEDCDDGNDEDGNDSCRNDCTWRCSKDAECNEDDPCGPYGVCDTDNHVCVDGEPVLREAEACSIRGIVGRCIDSRCVTEACNNGVAESELGEECDDGNASDNDACLINCLLNRCGDGFLYLG
ncbi:MAG: hypothetical protein ABIJ56_23255, partial [Pseudomonadota bacterium]